MRAGHELRRREMDRKTGALRLDPTLSIDVAVCLDLWSCQRAAVSATDRGRSGALGRVCQRHAYARSRYEHDAGRGRLSHRRGGGNPDRTFDRPLRHRIQLSHTHFPTAAADSPIAFVPIVILWFGLTEWGKWFLVFWGVFFTVWVATHLGVHRADPALVRAARSLGASDRLLIRDVILPSALPTIFVGLRTAISISFYTLVAAELAGAFAGLAYRIDLAHQNMQTGQMLGGLVMLGVVSAAADRGFAMLSRRLAGCSLR